MNKRLLLTACVLAALQPAFAQNSSPYWSLAGNNNATASAKLGTTNSIPLRLFTNNAERLRIDANGKVSIGMTGAIGKFTLFSNGSLPGSKWVLNGAPVFTSFAEGTGGNADHILAMASNTPTARPNMIVRRSRGTLTSPTAVANGDFLSSLQASGYDGVNFQNPANVDFFVDGAPSAGHVPARISFSTGTNLGNRAERFTIKSSGNIGIGTTTPTYKLQVADSTVSSTVYVQNKLSSRQDGTAIVGYSVSADGFGYGIRGTGGYIGLSGFGNGGNWSGPAYGVYATSLGSAGSRYGIYAYSSGSGVINSFGVYGKAEGGVFNAAGYFSGDVWASAFRTLSDRKFKSDIKPLEHALSGLMKLRPTTYSFNVSEYKGMHLPSEKQIGLIADEVKAVFPELVSAGVHPAEHKEGTKEEISPEIKYEGVNYQGLIPVLIASVQEQQKIIQKQEELNQKQQQQIDELKYLVAKLSGTPLSLSTAGSLGQSTPNPTSGTAKIAYTVPQGAQNARLLLTDGIGRTIRTLLLSESGTANIETASLSSGVYHYSLVIDGKVIQTRKMTVAK